MALGAYADKSLAQARGDLSEARKLLAAGVDPMAVRKADKAGIVQVFVDASALVLEGSAPEHRPEAGRLLLGPSLFWTLAGQAGRVHGARSTGI